MVAGFERRVTDRLTVQLRELGHQALGATGRVAVRTLVTAAQPDRIIVPLAARGDEVKSWLSDLDFGGNVTRSDEAGSGVTAAARPAAPPPGKSGSDRAPRTPKKSKRMRRLGSQTEPYLRFRPADLVPEEGSAMDAGPDTLVDAVLPEDVLQGQLEVIERPQRPPRPVEPQARPLQAPAVGPAVAAEPEAALEPEPELVSEPEPEPELVLEPQGTPAPVFLEQLDPEPAPARTESEPEPEPQPVVTLVSASEPAPAVARREPPKQPSHLTVRRPAPLVAHESATGGELSDEPPPRTTTPALGRPDLGAKLAQVRFGDYHSILELPPGEPDRAVREQHEQIARRYSPGGWPGRLTAEELEVLVEIGGGIRDALAILGDPDLRMRYEAALAESATR